jgi:predicted transcriptional regulator
MKKLLLSLAVCGLVFGVEVGEIPPKVVLDGEKGGCVDGKAWDSSMLRDKVYVVFYVDPDEKDKNEHFAKSLKAKHYDRSKYGSVAIVNMAATWKPNFIIEKILASKQEKYKDTLYVKDVESTLVKEWNLDDDESDIIVFDKDSKVLFYKAGKMSEEDMQKAFEIIEENI